MIDYVEIFEDENITNILYLEICNYYWYVMIFLSCCYQWTLYNISLSSDTRHFNNNNNNKSGLLTNKQQESTGIN